MDILKNYKNILGQYGISGEIAFKDSSGGFNKSWIVLANDNKYFLKSRNKKAYERTLTDCEISDFLNAKGINTAKPFKTTTDEYIISDGNYIFTLFNFIKARNYNDSEKDLRSAARTLAKIHKVGEEYSGTMAFKTDSIAWTDEQIKANQTNNSAPYLKKSFESAKRNIDASTKKLPKTLIHWDFHGGNMKFDQDECIPFDFEFSHKDYRILDVANSLICLTALDQNKISYNDAKTFIQDCKIDNVKANKFIQSYSEINKIKNDEFKILPDALQVAWSGWVLYTINKLECPQQLKKGMYAFPKWLNSEDGKKTINALRYNND